MVISTNDPVTQRNHQAADQIRPELRSRKLPPLPTILTLTKRRHRLVCTPRLRLRKTHLFLLTLATLHIITHTLLLLRHHRIIQILLLDFFFFLALFLALHFLVRH